MIEHYLCQKGVVDIIKRFFKGLLFDNQCVINRGVLKMKTPLKS